MTSAACDDAALARARRRLIEHRLPVFASAWLAAALVWVGVLVVEERLTPGMAALAVAAQAAIVLGTMALSRTLADPRRALVVVVAGCIALGVSASAVFLGARGNADFLAFVLLTLYLASSLFFAWGWQPTLALLAATVGPWLVVVPRLPTHVPAAELIGAILIGSALSLAAAEGYARTFRAAIRHERERDAVRARERAALAAAEHARTQAEEATRIKDQFLAIVSHELRSPLAATLAWSRTLRRGNLTSPAAARALDGVERSVRQSVRLVEDLLDVSRIIRGKLHVEMADVDLRAVVATVAENVRLVANEKGVTLDVRLPRESLSVRGDSARLRQVVENLFSNALKFTEAGGRVDADLRQTPSGVELTVRDTGIGIPPNVLPHVFESFRQADDAITRRHAGLGLGLAIARHLVEAHGGTIEAESEGEGHGATLRVWLPSPRGADTGRSRGPAGPRSRP